MRLCYEIARPTIAPIFQPACNVVKQFCLIDNRRLQITKHPIKTAKGTLLGEYAKRDRRRKKDYDPLGGRYGDIHIDPIKLAPTYEHDGERESENNTTIKEKKMKIPSRQTQASLFRMSRHHKSEVVRLGN